MYIQPVAPDEARKVSIRKCVWAYLGHPYPAFRIGGQPSGHGKTGAFPYELSQSVQRYAYPSIYVKKRIISEQVGCRAFQGYVESLPFRMEVIDDQICRSSAASFHPDVGRYVAVHSDAAVRNGAFRDVECHIHCRNTSCPGVVPPIDIRIHRDGGIGLQFRECRDELPSPEPEDIVHPALVYSGIAFYIDAVRAESRISLHIYRKSGDVSGESVDGYPWQGIADKADSGLYLHRQEYPPERSCCNGGSCLGLEAEMPFLLPEPQLLHGEGKGIPSKPSSYKQTVGHEPYPVAVHLPCRQPAAEFHLLDAQCSGQCVLAAAEDYERLAIETYTLQCDLRKRGEQGCRVRIAVPDVCRVRHGIPGRGPEYVPVGGGVIIAFCEYPRSSEFDVGDMDGSCSKGCKVYGSRETPECGKGVPGLGLAHPEQPRSLADIFIFCISVSRVCEYDAVQGDIEVRETFHYGYRNLAEIKVAIDIVIGYAVYNPGEHGGRQRYLYRRHQYGCDPDNPQEHFQKRPAFSGNSGPVHIRLNWSCCKTQI